MQPYQKAPVRRILGVMCMLLTISSLLACSPKKSASVEGSATPTVTAAPTANPYPFNEDGASALYRWNREQVVRPFWLGNVMYNESVTFTLRADGTITGKTLCVPKRIVCLRSYDLKTEYEPGKDFIWHEGTNTLSLPEGSRLYYFTAPELAGEGVKNWSDAPEGMDSLGRARFGNALYCVNEIIYNRQYNLTYVYEPADFQGTVSPFMGDRLPKTMEKLKSKQDIRLVFFGDSNHVGCESSGYYHREPNTPPYPRLVAAELEASYGIKVTLRNLAVGGKTSQWGVETVDSVIRQKPDLLVIGFGNNDLAGGGDPNTVIRNINTIMAKVSAELPDCEFILVGPILANKEANFIGTNDKLPALTRPIAKNKLGVIYLDMFTLCQDLLKTKEDFISISGNNINHPNEWLARIYAMDMAAALIDYKNIPKG